MHNQARNRRTSAHSTPPTKRGPMGQVRSASSASATPTGIEEDEEGGPKRSTRGRNPLPPSAGPLFPPLPPKVPKLPKGLSSSSLHEQLQADAAAEAEAEAEKEKPDIDMAQEPAATTSNAGSLTPPPPGSESIVGDADVDGEDGEGEGEGDITVQEVKVEDDLPPAEAEADADAGAEDVASTEKASSEQAKERAEAHSRSKRRRGEEALLLDDHLLPAEMRRTGQLPGKRAHHASFGAESATKPVIKHDAKAEAEADAADVEMKEPEPKSEITAELTTDPDQDQEEDGEDEQEDEDDGQDVTRCVCHQDDIDVMMIQCDKCNVWQHGPCMGVWADEEAPDEYFCEECRPDLHGPLKRWIRSCGRNPSMFVPPRPEDLKKLRPYNDKSPPSQSKRWTDPALMSPPPPSGHSNAGGAAPKSSSSRSHHKKEDPPAAAPDASSASSSRPARRLPFPERERTSEKPPSSSNKDKAVAGVRRRQGSVGANGSASPNRSLSPSTALHSAARRRITMNSRDAIYEEEYKAAIEASRREALGLPPLEVEVPDEAVEDEESAADKKESKKGKRKRDEDSVEPSSGPGGSKIKHPNQYTYRPKPASSSHSGPAGAIAGAAAVAAAAAAAAASSSTMSPARRGAGTPVPTLAPPQHDHGTRRAGAIASGAIINPTLSAQSVANLNWYLPEHLSAHSDLLPTPQPVALDVRSQRTLPSISRNHYHNQRYGPFSDTRDAQGKLVLPETQPLRAPAGEAETRPEPPARVKYPARRITVGEMRKRVRSILEYVSKIQGTEEKRIERNTTLGIVVKPLPPKTKVSPKAKSKSKLKDPEQDAEGDVDMDMDVDEQGQEQEQEQDTADADGDDTTAEPDATAPAPAQTSTELMEELTRDLLAFQETFASGANGLISPMPPAVPAFEAPLSIPVPIPDSAPETDIAAEAAMPDAPVPVPEPEETQDTTTTGLDVYREGTVDKVLENPTLDPAEEPQLDTAPVPEQEQEPAVVDDSMIADRGEDAGAKIGLGLVESVSETQGEGEAQVPPAPTDTATPMPEKGEPPAQADLELEAQQPADGDVAAASSTETAIDPLVSAS